MGQAIETATYRRLWHSDSAAFRDHLLRLPVESRHNRFGMAVADDFVERYSLRSSAIENVLYGFFDDDGILRAVGELRPLSPPHLLGVGGEMEAAFSVEPGWRKRGVASELMARVIRAARVRCCTTLYLSFLTGNVPMRRLAMKFGARIETDHSESAATIHPEWPTPDAILGKNFDDAKSFAIAALNLQRQRLSQDAGARN